MPVEENASSTEVSPQGSAGSSLSRPDNSFLFLSLFSAPTAKKRLAALPSPEGGRGLEMDSHEGIPSSHADGVPRRQHRSRPSFPFQNTWLGPHSEWSRPVRETSDLSKGPAFCEGNLANPSCHGNRAPSFNIYYVCFSVWGLCFRGLPSPSF